MLELVTTIDEALASFLGPLGRIIVWAILSGVASMVLYRLVSPQSKLTALKEQQKHARKQLLQYDGPFDGMMALISKDLGLAFKQIGIVLLPFIISVIPILALMFCLFVRYGFAFPAPDTPTLIQVEPPGASINLAGAFFYEQTENGWEVPWPPADAPIYVLDDNGTRLLTMPPPAAIPEVSKENWLTMLFPNPAGTLPNEALVDAMFMDIPSQHYTEFGPDWMRGFAFWYFSVLLAVSLFIKIRFKII